jgi:hypothetical protein
MRVAAETADFKVAKTGIEGVSECRRRLRRPLVSKHQMVPGNAGQLVGFFARVSGALVRRPDRRALLRQFVYDGQASANFRILR